MQDAKEIPGFSKFRITKCGEVFNSRGRKLKSYPLSGYLRISLTRDDGYRQGMSVHRLVIMAHLGPIPDGMWVNHINGEKSDNRLENLEVGTPKHNRLHAKHVLGRKCQPLGEKNGNYKLSEKQVREIKSLLADGLSHRAIASRYGVSQPAISYIRSGRCWSHVFLAPRT